MAQDHAKKKKSSAPKHRSGSGGTPNWAWLITGLVLGAFIMFLVYLSGLSPQKPLQLPTLSSKKTPDANAPAPVQEKPIFEFYDSLKKNEIIPPGEAPATAQPVATTPPPAPPASIPPSATATDAAPTTPADKPIYVLQVASLPKEADADALKAKLTLDGLDTQVQPFNNKGDTWYRVVVGPISDPDKLSQAKAILALQNLTPLVLQKKPAAPVN